MSSCEFLEDRTLLSAETIHDFQYFYGIFDELKITDAGGWDGRAKWSMEISGAPDDAFVKSLDIKYWINHPDMQELDVWLTTERDGTWYDKQLWARATGPSEFQDHLTDLSDWNGISPNGTWYLMASDYVEGNVGGIDGWKLWIDWQTPEVTSLSWKTSAAPSAGNALSRYPGETVYVRADAIGMAGQTISVRIYEEEDALPDLTDDVLNTVNITIGQNGYGTGAWTTQMSGQDDAAPDQTLYLFYDAPFGESDRESSRLKINRPEVQAAWWEGTDGSAISDLSEVEQGEQLRLVAIATGYGASDVFTASIFDDDVSIPPTDSGDDDAPNGQNIPLRYQSGARWTGTWTAEWDEDVFDPLNFDSDPEYYFVVNGHGDRSGHVKVRKPGIRELWWETLGGSRLQNLAYVKDGTEVRVVARTAGMRGESVTAWVYEDDGFVDAPQTPGGLQISVPANSDIGWATWAVPWEVEDDWVAEIGLGDIHPEYRIWDTNSVFDVINNVSSSLIHAYDGPLPNGKWTVLTHGLTNDTFDDLTNPDSGWVYQMAAKIAAESIRPNSVQSNVIVHSFDWATGEMSEANLIDSDDWHHVFWYDWAGVSNLDTVNRLWELETFLTKPPGSGAHGDDGYAEAAGDALFAILSRYGITEKLDTMIGYSRGGIVTSKAVQRILAAHGIVDQVIYLDAEGGGSNEQWSDPRIGLYEDESFFAWDGVRVTDNYYSRFVEIPFNFDLGGHRVLGARGVDVTDAFAHTRVLTTPGIQEYFSGDSLSAAGLFISNGDIVTLDTPSITTGSTADHAAPENDPPAPLELFNGGFEWNSTAGWWYHGGGNEADGFGGGLVVNADQFNDPDGPDDLELLLNSGQSRTHNWVVVPEGAKSLQFDLEIIDTDPNDRLRVYYEGNGGLFSPIWRDDWDLALSSISSTDLDGNSLLIPLPSGAEGETVLATVVLEGTGDGSVWIDNVTFSDQLPSIHVAIDVASVDEGAGSVFGTVTRRDGLIGHVLEVYLSVDENSTISVPEMVTIPVGQQSATFEIAITDNDLIDGNRLEGIAAEIPFSAILPAEGALTIVDDDTVAPVFTTPNNTVTANGLFALAWGDVAGADGYEVWYTNASTGQNPVINETVSTNSFAPSAALPIGRYNVWVRVKQDDGSTSDWSTGIRLHINTAVNLHSLPFQGNDRTPTLKWDPLPGASRYEVWIRNVTAQQSRVVHDADVSATTFTVPADLAFGLHRIWVRGRDAGGSVAGWSSTLEYSIGPQPLGPVQPILSTRPTFRWSEIPGAATYDLYAGTAGGVIVTTDINAAEWTPQTDLAEGPVRWWVRGTTSSGRKGPWSLRGDSHTVGRPIAIGPTETTADASPRFEWTAVEHAVRFELSVWRLDDPGRVIQNAQLPTNTFESSILPDGNYRFWVRAFDASDQPGWWSRPADFVIDAATLTLSTTPLALLNSTFETKPTFAWTVAPGAATYDLYVRNGNDVLEQTAIAAPFWTATQSMDTGQWKWWVRAVDAAGAAGPWSEMATTDTSGRPVFAAPSGDTSDRTPTIAWTAVSGASHYVFQLDNLTTEQNSQIRDDDVVGNSFTPDTPLAPGIYRAWVRAINGSNNQPGPWSLRTEFSVVSVIDTDASTDENLIHVHSLLIAERLVPDQNNPDEKSVSEDSRRFVPEREPVQEPAKVSKKKGITVEDAPTIDQFMSDPQGLAI